MRTVLGGEGRGLCEWVAGVRRREDADGAAWCAGLSEVFVRSLRCARLCVGAGRLELWLLQTGHACLQCLGQHSTRRACVARSSPT